MVYLRMELLFDACADQLKVIPVTLKIMKIAKLEQADHVHLCNPAGIPQVIYGECFSSHSVALRG